jgi:hypothetical protein
MRELGLAKKRALPSEPPVEKRRMAPGQTAEEKHSCWNQNWTTRGTDNPPLRFAMICPGYSIAFLITAT